jgi:cytoskeletal protein RodZ
MNHLNPDQVEQLKEIGAQLRQLRQEQSISTEEVAAKTFIPSRLLTALEEGQPERLPEPVFIQGFIRRYADVLDLDGAAIANTFPANFLPSQLDTSSQEFSPATFRTIPLYVIYIFLLIIAASGLFFVVKRPQAVKPTPQKKTSVVAVQPEKTVRKSVPSTPSTSKASASAPALPIQVAVSLNDESWMQVIVDGKIEYEGTLSKGTQKSWTAKKKLTLVVGNAGAVLISSNREKQKVLGNTREVKEVTFTPGE